ncbi:MAG: ABC transporter ATP-binding protein [Candidatus Theseobacter exili]|nr:ABC transporter ATP-binding protein [Candidatus Theseobacter exili]
MNTYHRLLMKIKPYRSRIIWAMVFMVLFSALNTAVAWILRYVLKTGFDYKYSTFLNPISLLIVFTFLFRGLFDYGRAYLMNWVGQRAIMDIRNDLYSHIQTLSVDFFADRRTGQLISRITNDVAIVQSSISNIVTDLIQQPLCIIGLAVTVFIWDPVLALLSMLVFPVTLLPIIKYGKRLRKASFSSQAKMADLTSILHETFTGARIVKAFAMEEYEIDKFKVENKQLFKHAMEIVKSSVAVRPIIEAISSVGVAFAIWYGAKHFDKATFLAFMGALFLLYEPVKKLSRVNNTIQQALAAGGRIFEIIDEKTSVPETESAQILPAFSKTIDFKDVSFSYEDSTVPVIEKVNFQMKRGQVTALVGPSGVGKTTIANLIPRFYDPTNGRILVDGLDIRDVSLASLRKQIGIVTQETILFNDTIKHNISYGNLECLDEEIFKAAQAANAHSFIQETPDGYNTVVGEKGVKLSGGQRQRLAIARAILKDPPVLILDEATSALDTESERLVQEAIEHLMEQRTCLVIAHRLSTVQSADAIIVLSNGKIIGHGTHDELMDSCPSYRKIYKLQFNL